MADTALVHTIHIRAAQASDAMALAQFAQASFAETFAYRHYPSNDLAQFYADYMDPARFTAQMANPDYAIGLAIDDTGQIVGFVKTGPVGVPLPTTETNIAAIELHQLYLAKHTHGTGLANRLMAQVWARAQRENAAAVYLSVYSENIRAQKFYARHGFCEIGKNPFAVGTVIDDDRVWKAPVPGYVA